MIHNQLRTVSIFALLFALVIGCSPEVKMDYELHRASVDMAKAYRQAQMADNAFYNGNDEAAVKHLSRGLDLYQAALEHLSKAEDNAYQAAGDEIDKGNNQMQKSLDEYDSGNTESAEEHYDKALKHYDKALDLLDV